MIAVAMVLVRPGVLPGAVINIDFQVGADRVVQVGSAGAVIPTGGSYWNVNGANGSVQELLTSEGAPSGVTLRSDLSPALGTDEADALFGDSVFGEATLGGLNPGQRYRLVIYGGANLQNIYRVRQSFATLSPEYGTILCEYGHTALPGVDGCDYVHGEALADAAGEIAVEVLPGAMAGLQLALNPEPSVLVLQAIGALFLAVRRRRESGGS